MKKLQEVNNLATANKSDFTITDGGKAFVSQRKAAELCGVSQQAVSVFCLSKNIKVKQGVNDENLSLLVTHYAEKGKPEAVQTLILFAKAGAKAYIFHEAGYTLKAESQTVLSPLELAKIQVQLLEQIIVKDEVIEKQSKEIEDFKEVMGISENYSPIAIMKKRFPEFNFSGGHLTKTAKSLGEDIIKAYSLHENKVNQYTIKTWLQAYPTLSQSIFTKLIEEENVHK